jgi:hypothetical protein
MKQRLPAQRWRRHHRAAAESAARPASLRWLVAAVGLATCCLFRDFMFFFFKFNNFFFPKSNSPVECCHWGVLID